MPEWLQSVGLVIWSGYTIVVTVIAILEYRRKVNAEQEAINSEQLRQKQKMEQGITLNFNIFGNSGE